MTKAAPYVGAECYPGKRRKVCPSWELKKALQGVEQAGAAMVLDARISERMVDRDGDLLEPAGFEVDRNSPMLLNHDASKVVGKLLKLTRQDKQAIEGRFMLADTELGRDAAKLVELGCLRISHGFLPHDYTAIKNKKGEQTGWHVTRLTLLETSLVAIPSNTGALVLAYQKNEIKSPEIRAWAKSFLPAGENDPSTSQDAATDGVSESVVTGQEDAASEPDPFDEFDQGVQRAVAREVEIHDMATNKANKRSSGVDPNEVIANAPHASDQYAPVRTEADSVHVRVKSMSERFSTARKSITTNRHGLPAYGVGGKPLEDNSEWDAIQAGVYFKKVARKSGIPVPWTEFDQAVLMTMAEKHPWSGEVFNAYRGHLDSMEVKTILNDETSGGLYISPDFFSDRFIVRSLWGADIMPFCEVLDLPRGATVATALIEHPTLSWTGNAEGSAMGVFDDSGLIAPITATVRCCTVAIEMGLDAISDFSIANFGNLILRLIGERMSEEMDRICAVGAAASSEPVGILESPLITSVPSDTTSAGPVTIYDAENLVFAIPRQYRSRVNNPRWLMADSTFKHFRQVRVATGTALTYAASVFDQNAQAIDEPRLWEYPVSTCNSIAAGTAAFVAMRRYRLWRRADMQSRYTDQGRTLALSNTALLTVRSRWASSGMTIPEAAAYTSGIGVHQDG